jgi:type IV secretion system protein VirB9
MEWTSALGRQLLGVAVLLGFLAPLTARAVETPRASPTDTRVRFVDYDETQVYRLNGVFRAATHIIFGAGEEIASVALGDTVSWEVAPAENSLFVKPREAAGPTNLIVITRRANERRTYTFELSVRPGSIASGTDAIFQLRFRYPREDALAAQQRLTQQRIAKAQQVEAGAVRLALDAAVLEGPRNLNYLAAGSSALLPTEVTDNGQFTVMRFPRNQALPAIFTVNPDGQETIVPFDVRDDFVVIHQVAAEFRLRRGTVLACIWNGAVDPYGKDLTGGTASPDVERITKGPDNE